MIRQLGLEPRLPPKDGAIGVDCCDSIAMLDTRPATTQAFDLFLRQTSICCSIPTLSSDPGPCASFWNSSKVTRTWVLPEADLKTLTARASDQPFVFLV